MEGFSRITYKNKTINYVNYSIFQSDAHQKQKMLELLKFAEADRIIQPLDSALVLVNVSNLSFDMDTLKQFKESVDRMDPFDKKMAVVGVTGLIKTAYNFVFGLTQNRKRKAFDSELEAKEWLVVEG